LHLHEYKPKSTFIIIQNPAQLILLICKLICKLNKNISKTGNKTGEHLDFLKLESVLEATLSAGNTFQSCRAKRTVSSAPCGFRFNFV